MLRWSDGARTILNATLCLKLPGTDWKGLRTIDHGSMVRAHFSRFEFGKLQGRKFQEFSAAHRHVNQG